MTMSNKLTLLLVLGMLALASSLPMMTEDLDKGEWVLIGPAEPTHPVRLNIAIKQQNLDELNRIFWAVSNPTSPQYGKFLSADEVSELVMPDPARRAQVIDWVLSSGIKEYEMELTRSRDMITVHTSVQAASALLAVEYQAYYHSVTGASIVKSTTETYAIPSHMQKHVDFVVGHTHFPLAHRTLITSPAAAAAITPVVLRQRYNVTANLVASAKNNSLAVAEFQGQYYSPSDLQQFFQSEVPYAPTEYSVEHVIGENDGSHPGIEANLDIQFIMGVAPNVEAWFWSNPNMDFFGDIVTWLSQIDNTTEAPLVHSVSYGSQTIQPSPAIHDRVDIEFQKSGARGISIIFASGDSGTGCLLCAKFQPSWPASSDYVTSVGATRFIDGASGDEAAVDNFGSGGGFSSADNQPSYQQAAVAHYFKVQTDLPESFYYNASGRGTPDVAALGVGFQVVVGGRVTSVAGTSASAPTFSAIIAMLNDLRLNNYKSPLGFLNPWLYQTQAANPTAFFDVTVGDNHHGCCGLTGFKTAPGWDPVTGLGTPNYAVLAQLV